MPGSARLRDCQILREITTKQAEAKRLYAAICAAPAITLKPWGLLNRKQVISKGLMAKFDLQLSFSSIFAPFDLMINS